MTANKSAADTLRELAALLGRPQPAWKQVDHSRPKAIIVTFANPLTVRLSLDLPDYLGLLAKFDAVLPDGQLLASSASRILGRSVLRSSFDGNSLAPEVFSHCRSNRLRVALIGGTPGIAEAAASEFEREFGITIPYKRSGFFASESDRAAAIRELVARKIDVLVCGMGAPHQDRFLLDAKETEWKGVGFSCGGYLDQAVCGGVRYYPEIVNRLNLRAPYRLLREPRRLWKRYLIEYQPFLIADLRLRLSGRIS